MVMTAGGIAAVSFDFHGTLAVPCPHPGAIYAQVAAQHGIEADADALNADFPQEFRRIRDAWLRPYGADESDAREFWFAVVRETFPMPVSESLVQDCFTAFGSGDNWQLLPSAQACLQLCRERGLPLVVCSNFDLRLVSVLTDLQLGPFEEVLVSSVVGEPKPDPEMLLLACTLLEIEPENLLHIGDNPQEDGIAAEKAGCPFLLHQKHIGPDPKLLRQRLDHDPNSDG